MNKHVTHLKKNEKLVDQENVHTFFNSFKTVAKLKFSNFFSLLEIYFNPNISDVFTL